MDYANFTRCFLHGWWPRVGTRQGWEDPGWAWGPVNVILLCFERPFLFLFRHGLSSMFRFLLMDVQYTRSKRKRDLKESCSEERKRRKERSNTLCPRPPTNPLIVSLDGSSPSLCSIMCSDVSNLKWPQSAYDTLWAGTIVLFLLLCFVSSQFNVRVVYHASFSVCK